MASLETPPNHHCCSLGFPAGAPMVKFSKKFEAQLVPEWKEAFVDYWQLKKDVKKLQTVAGGGAVVPSPWLHQKPPATAHWVMRLPFLHSHGHHREPAAIQACTNLAS